jgi:hypothetical protein
MYIWVLRFRQHGAPPQCYAPTNNALPMITPATAVGKLDEYPSSTPRHHWRTSDEGIYRPSAYRSTPDPESNPSRLKSVQMNVDKPLTGKIVNPSSSAGRCLPSMGCV